MIRDQYGKERIKNKAEELFKKYVVKDPKPEIFKGVYIGDKILEELEIKNNKTKVANKATIYGGIEGVTKEQEEILMLPPGHSIYPKLNLEAFETELEKCVIKAKWEKFRESCKQEEQNKRLELDEPETTSKKVFDDEKNTIDFRNLKATDLKNNKRIVIPKLDADDDEEIM